MSAAPGPAAADTDLAEVDPEEVVAQVRRWVERARRRPGRRWSRDPSERLRALLRDPDGLPFAVRFVDQVLRPADAPTAARLLRAAVDDLGAPRFLPATDRALLRVGAWLGPHLPKVVVPLARRRVRHLVGHLVVDARPRPLSRHLTRAPLGTVPVRRNLNLLGEAVLGEDEARRRRQAITALLRRPDVDHVSVKVSGVASQLGAWDLDAERDRVLERLVPLYREARDTTPPVLVTLDMEEHRDLDLTLAVVEALLAAEELRELPVGVALQAYLPDTAAAIERVVSASAARVAAGGVAARVRLVKGANLALERVEAERRGWVPAPYDTKAEVDAAFKRHLDRLLRPEVVAHLRLGVGSHNLFDLAYALHLARARGVDHAVEVEMLEGMAPELAAAVGEDVGGLLLYTPVVAPADLDAATAYLVRRLEEVAAPQNFLRSAFHLTDPVTFAREERRFRAALAARDTVDLAPRRGPVTDPVPASSGATFVNEPDRDPSRPHARERVAAALTHDPGPAVTARTDTLAGVDAVVATARAAGARWAQVPAADRRATLRRVADGLAAAREELVAVMAHEAGKTVTEADPEVSEAIDFARWYADRAGELDADPEVTFTPHRVVVVTPPWNFPVAIPLGGCLAALAAGAAVVAKPAPQAERCLELAVTIAHAAGVDPEVLQLVRVPEDAAGRRLVTHPDVDAVVLTGAHETARRFRRWRPDLRLHAETSGKNALVITPSADVDLAVADLVGSAFGHAGQKCSAASLAILVGDVDADGRLRRQLVDATRSLRVGPAIEPASRIGPLIGPPTGDLARALTRLDAGERWLLAPQPLDDAGRRWRPGIRDRVVPGSWFHHTECFGPVLGLIEVPDLVTAIAVQNATRYGLTGGIHSLDEREVARWLAEVEVGNAYVNRSITGAIVRRQPFGGWKRSSVGPGAKAGGPHYVAQFGTWRDRAEPAPRPSTPVTGPAARRLAALRPHLDAAEVAWLERAAASDQVAWDATFSREHDPSALGCEANVLRYRPRPTLGTHLAADGARVHALRVVLAAIRAGVRVRWSHAPDVHLPAELLSAVAAGLDGPPAVRDGPGAVADLADRAGVDARLRVVGTPTAGLWAAAADASVDVLAEPVTASGRRELLTVLREQAVSRTMHRYGTPVRGPAILPPPR